MCKMLLLLLFWGEVDWRSKKRGDKPTKGPLAVSDLLRLQVYWNISGRWYTIPNLTDRNNDFSIVAFKALDLQCNYFQHFKLFFRSYSRHFLQIFRRWKHLDFFFIISWQKFMKLQLLNYLIINIPEREKNTLINTQFLLPKHLVPMDPIFFLES